MDGGVCGPFGRHLGVLRGIGSLVEYRDLKPRIVLLSGCTVAVLAYIFRSQRVTLEVILAAVTVYLLIAFSFATIYNIAFQFDFQSFRFPEWIEAGSTEILRTSVLFQPGHPGDPGLWRYSPQLPFTPDAGCA